MSAEERFKQTATVLIRLRLHPTPARMQRALGHREGRHDLNGREMKWLRHDLDVHNMVYPNGRSRGFYGNCRFICCGGERTL